MNASEFAPHDRRGIAVRHYKTTYTMPAYDSLAAWQARAAELRTRILFCTGLWPLPKRTPLRPRVLGHFERDGYVLENIAIEPLPGFLLCGNLYSPAKATGRVPGVLCPHGHQRTGRLEHSELVSTQARCIQLARMGCVVFAYDMVGYNDTNQMPHALGGPQQALWGISLMGLQLWNSIRALDFLLSLPDIDPERIGCTGASGGGTQTFMLAAVDERVRVVVPAVMVSAHMQGGCPCENAPGLRVETNNMEIAALAAPRPLLMIAATGDWTANTATVEYPAVRGIYRQFAAEDRVAYRIFEAPHNYNLASREAMYAWFARWFFNAAADEACRERPFTPEQPRDLLVYYGRRMPTRRLDADELSAALVATAKAALERATPRTRRGLARFRRAFAPALQHALAATFPAATDLVQAQIGETAHGAYGARQLLLGRRSHGDRVPALWFAPRGTCKRAVVLVHPDGSAGALAASAPDTRSALLIARLLNAGAAVLTLDCFATGDAGTLPEPPADVAFLDTYNRTLVANRVQDILTAAAAARALAPGAGLSIVGVAEAGAWALLAAGLVPNLHGVAADAAGLDTADDGALLERVYTPGLRRAGDFDTACLLAFPARLLIHHTAGRFTLPRAARGYAACGGELNMHESAVPAGDLAQWLLAE